MKSKRYDCVAEKHKAARQLMKEIGSMTHEEEIAFWKKLSDQMKARQNPKRRVAAAHRK